MPLWKVYHPDNTFTDVGERQELASAITKIYTDRGLPAFYVGVIFISQAPQTIFRGGQIQPTAADQLQPSENRPPFIRIVWTNIAGGFPDPGRTPAKTGFLDVIDNVLRPFTAAKGWDWEHHGEDADVTLGRIGGYDFPPRHSDTEKFWFETNEPKPLPKDQSK